MGDATKGTPIKESLPRRLGVLISGRGSNLQALIRAVQDERLDATIAVVISNVADAPGLAHVHAPSLQCTLEEYDQLLAEEYQRLMGLAGASTVAPPPINRNQQGQPLGG